MYEYKCVGAPERSRRAKGAKTGSDRVARAIQQVIDAEAVDGWEYQRTDLLPVEEKTSLFARPREVHRAVLVFRRAKEQKSFYKSRPTDEQEPLRLAADRSDAPGAAFEAGRLRAGQSDT